MSIAMLEALPRPVALQPQRGFAPAAAVRRIREIQLSGGVIVSWHSSTASVDLRRSHRVSFEGKLLITPLADSCDAPAGESFAVLGRDISVTGVSFLHEQTLASRRVAVSFPLDDGQWESVVTALRWCRFRRDGLYQSGGQFLRPVSLDPAELESRPSIDLLAG